MVCSGERYGEMKSKAPPQRFEIKMEIILYKSGKRFQNETVKILGGMSA